MSTETRRRHARIESDFACTVDGKAAGRIRNLSVGAALVVAPAGLANIDATVSLDFQVGEVSLTGLRGEVLRIAAHDTGCEYGIQFLAVQPADDVRLARCLDLLLSGPGVGRRASPRLYRRVDLRCHAGGEFYATMSDLSLGGLGLECELSLRVGDEVAFEVLVGSLDAPFKLSGVVAHARRTPSGLHRAGLRFGPLSARERASLEQTLQSVLQ